MKAVAGLKLSPTIVVGCGVVGGWFPGKGVGAPGRGVGEDEGKWANGGVALGGWRAFTAFLR